MKKLKKSAALFLAAAVFAASFSACSVQETGDDAAGFPAVLLFYSLSVAVNKVFIFRPRPKIAPRRHS